MTIHEASLVDSSTHCIALLKFLELPISRTVIGARKTVALRSCFVYDIVKGHITSTVIEIVDLSIDQLDRARGRSDSRHNDRSKLTTFVQNVMRRAEINMAGVLVMLVYLHRAKAFLCIQVEEWANERVFLGALIVASKACIIHFEYVL
jgi:hypothetical protein